jgi:hypothetical protein
MSAAGNSYAERRFKGHVRTWERHLGGMCAMFAEIVQGVEGKFPFGSR